MILRHVSPFKSALYALCALCLLSVTHLHAQTPTPVDQAAQTQRVKAASESSKAAKSMYEESASKAKKQREYVKTYRAAISLVMKAEDDSVGSSSKWMIAAGKCQQSIDLLPKLKASSQGLNASDLPKGNILKAIDKVCGVIMKKAIIHLSAKECKSYHMLRRAYDYFETKDSATWTPLLKKIASCR
jgi:hypothetical protein